MSTPATAGELANPNLSLENTRVVSEKDAKIGDIISHEIKNSENATGHTGIYTGQVKIKQSIAGAGDGKTIVHEPSGNDGGTISASSITGRVEYRPRSQAFKPESTFRRVE